MRDEAGHSTPFPDNTDLANADLDNTDLDNTELDNTDRANTDRANTELRVGRGDAPGGAGDAEHATVVELGAVGHTFGDNEALRDLDLAVPRGRITVLLGPNGAGKTTTVRVITGALRPDTGLVRTLGHDPDSEGHLVRPRCGVVAAKPALYDRLSGYDNLDYSAELYGVTVDRSRRIAQAAERFGISSALGSMVGGYSTGMKTRLALARAILHDPELLLFDEPTSGLDPESSAAVLSYIRQMTDDGRTVVMCTHLLSEAEGLADHVVIMEGGTDLIAGSPEELTRRWWPHPVLSLGAQDPRLLERARGFPGVVDMRNDPSGARLEIDDLSRVPDIVESLVADGVRLTRVEPHRPTLEDLYFLIRRRLGDTARAEGREVNGVLDPIAMRGAAATGTGTAPTSDQPMPVVPMPVVPMPVVPMPAVSMPEIRVPDTLEQPVGPLEAGDGEPMTSGDPTGRTR